MKENNNKIINCNNKIQLLIYKLLIMDIAMVMGLLIVMEIILIKIEIIIKDILNRRNNHRHHQKIYNYVHIRLKKKNRKL